MEQVATLHIRQQILGDQIPFLVHDDNIAIGNLEEKGIVIA